MKSVIKAVSDCNPHLEILHNCQLRVYRNKGSVTTVLMKGLQILF